MAFSSTVTATLLLLAPCLLLLLLVPEPSHASVIILRRCATDYDCGPGETCVGSPYARICRPLSLAGGKKTRAGLRESCRYRKCQYGLVCLRFRKICAIPRRRRPRPRPSPLPRPPTPAPAAPAGPGEDCQTTADCQTGLICITRGFGTVSTCALIPPESPLPPQVVLPPVTELPAPSPAPGFVGENGDCTEAPCAPGLLCVTRGFGTVNTCIRLN